MRTTVSLVVLFAVVAAGCTEREVPLGPPTSPEFARIRVLDGGGFDDAVNVGAVVGTNWEPGNWLSLPGATSASFRVEGQPDGCADFGLCRAGNLVGQWGILGFPVFPDPNESPSGNASTAFAVITTGNFNPREPDFGYITNLESGIQRGFALPASAPGEYLDFRIDAAFGSGQFNNGPGQNDFAVAELVVDNTVVELLRWSRNDLQPGGQGNPVPGNIHCGTATMGTTQAFPLCTGWQRHYVDVNRFAGQNAIVRIRVRQALPDNDVASFLAFDNVRFEAYDALNGSVDIQPNDPTNTIDLSETATPISTLLFGSSALNVAAVDVSTFRLGDVAVAVTGNSLASTYGDFNNDGFGDVLLEFDRSVLIAAGVLTPQTVALELVGILPDRTRVRGTQPISIAGRAAMDVKPDKISLSLTSSVTVYLYSSATFDAANANPASIRWYNNGAGAGAAVARRNGLYMTSLRDFNGDGRIDRLLTFMRADLVAAGLGTTTTSYVVADRSGSLKFEATDGVPPTIVP